ncbi:DUF2914 domain-containing protein [Pseudoalteromonas luteoviolacea]|uniref:DUF2914 domain-containing protein n=1 Tax=Pseudoalteromonas luteoviolacea H33 TaxID=1365251 RepID=A0A161Y8M6_9GAMM|nr:DUF2914 domain-containing protein [Pseudoalteromonas luteoviolacea]KZN52300.1 hypothetical protein N476_11725 [Pseudoalteromonas luteoviolacea H33]KZN75801.1 hypothetical protein N477_17805 [Pseudoalteromonas luteoviolacea H33-S]MBQ4879220.1 DUF2914 domain-containing protein [Pseudoalteromonas luteoviolacea]MBQ4908280.1 DUF2914 domain-containing protein [Pseudoalteromonas luteoviolacea]
MTQRIVIKTKMTGADPQPRRVETVGYQYHWRRIVTAVCVASFGVTALSYGVFTSVYADEAEPQIAMSVSAAPVPADELIIPQPSVSDVEVREVAQMPTVVDEPEVVVSAEPVTAQITTEPAPEELPVELEKPQQTPVETVTEPPQNNVQTQFAADAQVASVALNAKVDTSHISRAVLTSGIENREPINVLKHLVEPNRFQEKLFFFTEIKGLQGEVVQHLWFHQDQLMADITLPVSTPRYRTYSSKNIMPSQTGEWRVEVITQGGQLLAQKSFRILAKAP